MIEDILKISDIYISITSLLYPREIEIKLAEPSTMIFNQFDALLLEKPSEAHESASLVSQLRSKSQYKSSYRGKLGY